MREYITAAEAARQFGLNRHYAARLAKKAANKGAKWPVKQGRTWIAPPDEWEKIFHPKGVNIRKKRKKEDLPASKKTSSLISASEAGRQLGISKSWASALAQKNHKNGHEWPKKVGNMWLAPIEQWQVIFNKKQKNKK